VNTYYLKYRSHTYILLVFDFRNCLNMSRLILFTMTIALFVIHLTEGGLVSTNSDGVCDSNDKSIWLSERREIKDALSHCGRRCLGGKRCTSRCMRKKEQITKPCSECFGKFVGCNRDNCARKCMRNSHASKCIRCVENNCVNPFIQCSGLTSPTKHWLSRTKYSLQQPNTGHHYMDPQNKGFTRWRSLLIIADYI